MDEAVGGPSAQLSVHGVHGDVAEVGGDVAGSPEASGLCGEQGQDPVPAAAGGGDVGILVGGGRQRLLGLGRHDGDVEIGDGAAGIGSAVVSALAVSGNG